MGTWQTWKRQHSNSEQSLSTSSLRSTDKSFEVKAEHASSSLWMKAAFCQRQLRHDLPSIGGGRDYLAWIMMGPIVSYQGCLKTFWKIAKLRGELFSQSNPWLGARMLNAPHAYPVFTRRLETSGRVYAKFRGIGGGSWSSRWCYEASRLQSLLLSCRRTQGRGSNPPISIAPTRKAVTAVVKLRGNAGLQRGFSG